jgi:hypothetical protein
MWQAIPFAEKLFTNVKETVLRKANAALENMFVNESGGVTRFPGLKTFTALPQDGKVYLSSYREDLIAVTEGGLMLRIDKNANVEDVTEVPISGGKRVVFAEGDNEIMCAAGGPIIRFAGEHTELLSENAPESTHVAYIDGYVVAPELESGVFRHSSTDARTWEDLDTFSADGNPDNINAIMTTPFREIVVGGPKSIEQFERLPNGAVPFFRRWAVGEGLSAPYTLLSADNATWFFNNNREFVRSVGQVSSSAGDDLGRTFEGVDNWSDAWAVPINIFGQKLILIQIPEATNIYGTKGITVVLDYRQKKWFSLYGWNDNRNVQARWPGWSYHRLWDRNFVGGEGIIYEIDEATFAYGSQLQKVLGRTAHIKAWGESRVNNVEVIVDRGTSAANTDEPFLWLRAKKDNKRWTRWIQRSLGKSGDSQMTIQFGAMGTASVWQFEYMTTGACRLDIIGMRADVLKNGR